MQTLFEPATFDVAMFWSQNIGSGCGDGMPTGVSHVCHVVERPENR